MHSNFHSSSSTRITRTEEELTPDFFVVDVEHAGHRPRLRNFPCTLLVVVVPQICGANFNLYSTMNSRVPQYEYGKAVTGIL